MRALLDRHGIEPSRALGQNFLADQNTARKIARLADVGPGDHVVEVGPGAGSLTLALAATGASITVIEKDRHLEALLAEVIDGHDVSVEFIDALAPQVVDRLPSGPFTVVSNLPYNVAGLLLIEMLRTWSGAQRFLLMCQLEVGERWVAAPGTKAYGIPSVKIQSLANAAVVASVPASVFVPKPRVESALVAVERLDADTAGPRTVPQHLAALDSLLATAFSKRRKTLRNSLGRAGYSEVMHELGIDDSLRREAIAVNTWCALALAVASVGEVGVSSPPRG